MPINCSAGGVNACAGVLFILIPTVLVIQHVHNRDGQKPQVFQKEPDGLRSQLQNSRGSDSGVHQAWAQTFQLSFRGFCDLLVALAPFFTAFLVPEMATTEMPPRFLFAQCIKCSNLVRSLFSASSSMMLRASSPSGRTLARRRNLLAFNAATSAMDLQRSFFLESACLSARSPQRVFLALITSILSSTVIPPSLCCLMVGSLAASIPLNSQRSFSVSSAAIPSALLEISVSSL